MSHLTRRRVWSGVGALASVAAVLLLFVYVFGQHGGGGAGPHSGTPIATSSTTPKATATTTGTPFQVSDQQVANQINVAYVQDNEVWLGMRGAQPEQVTHLGLSQTLTLDWRLIWSPDSSKLLVVANDNPPAQVTHPRVWIIAAETGSVTDVPSLGAADLSLGCEQACSWLTDRYIVHVNPNGGSPHYAQYEIYDTQTQRDISTALDNVAASDLEVRGSAVYFSGYYVSPSSMPGTINRFDLDTNTITANVFTAPGPLVSQGIPAASWDISADGSHVVYLFGISVNTPCQAPPCFSYYQDRAGVAELFPGYQSQAGGGAYPLSDLTISPDGQHAAALFGTTTGTPAGAPPEDILQQQVPSGAVSEEGVSSGNSRGWIAGWTTRTPGVILEQPRVDGNENTLSTSIYFAPLGSSGEAELVESLALPVNVAISISPS